MTIIHRRPHRRSSEKLTARSARPIRRWEISTAITSRSRRKVNQSVPARALRRRRADRAFRREPRNERGIEPTCRTAIKQTCARGAPTLRHGTVIARSRNLMHRRGRCSRWAQPFDQPRRKAVPGFLREATRNSTARPLRTRGLCPSSGGGCMLDVSARVAVRREELWLPKTYTDPNTRLENFGGVTFSVM